MLLPARFFARVDMMSTKSIYKRILLKLSGEMLQGKQRGGIDFAVVREMAKEVASLAKLGVEVAVVVGAGNFFRGREVRNREVDRSVADYMGMIATVMNAMALREALDGAGVKSIVLSAIHIPQVVQNYTIEDAIRAFNDGNVIVLGGGTGNPYFTTDTTVVLRALELNADAVFKATKVDGVYDKDPVRYSSAKKFDTLTYQEAIDQKLSVMDETAFALCVNNDIVTHVFKYAKGAFVKVATGEKAGTIITN